jgi:glyoxylase-like metal-dependent hydrolase (beta-lactamase superfamily II)
MTNPSSTPELISLALGPVETNCFILSVPSGPDPQGCYLIDCGMDPEPLLDQVAEHAFEPRGLLLTHCHYDHIGGIERLMERFGPMPIWVHPIEADWNRDPMLNLSGMTPLPCVAPAPDKRFEDGDRLDLLGTHWDVLHLPGHSPGSVALHDSTHGILLAGDTLFSGSVGRVDFPTSDPSAMKRSLERLMTLPDETVVHPGHGPATTIGRERVSNPYVLDPNALTQ